MADEKKPEELKKDGAAPAVVVEDKGQEKIDQEFTEREQALLGVIDKISADRDNYRAGLLAAKGKPSDGGDGLTEEERMRKIAEEVLASSATVQEISKAKEIIKTVLAENKELKVAIKNRGQFSGSPLGGGAGEKAQPAGGVGLTDEQIAALKKRNPKIWTDDKIRQLASTLNH